MSRFWKTQSTQLFLQGAVCLAGIQRAFGHGSDHPAKPQTLNELWRAWEWEPVTLICIALAASLYARGLHRIWTALPPGRGIRFWEAACFAGGIIVLAMALLTPIHAWSRVLFSVHMTQHEMLMLVAAPLLVLGRPMIVFLKGFGPGTGRRLAALVAAPWWMRTWTWITRPVAAWLIHAVVLWAWHIPAWFQATIDNDWIHALQHFSFLFSALLFWWAIMHGRHKMVGYGLATLYMFTTALHSGALGALITFAQSVIYPAYSTTTFAWGLTPLEDQQLGGLIMWVPAGLVYLIAALALIAGWLRESDARLIQGVNDRWELPLRGHSGQAHHPAPRGGNS